MGQAKLAQLAIFFSSDRNPAWGSQCEPRRGSGLLSGCICSTCVRSVLEWVNACDGCAMRFWSWPYSLSDDVEGSHWLLVPELRIWRLLWYAVIAPNLLFMFPFLCYMHMFWSIQDACWCSQAGESEGVFGVLVKVALLALFLRYVEALEADCISRVWLRVDLCAVTWQSASESAAQLMYSEIFFVLPDTSANTRPTGYPTGWLIMRRREHWLELRLGWNPMWRSFGPFEKHETH